MFSLGRLVVRIPSYPSARRGLTFNHSHPEAMAAVGACGESGDISPYPTVLVRMGL